MSIEIRAVSRTFGSFRALDRVSLRVERGEMVALLGPSGSGKTTLLRLIGGLDDPDPDGGAILLDGEDAARLAANRRRVGFVFQHYALFRHMTVFENVAFGLRVRPRRLRPSKAAIAARVAELLELVQLRGLARRYPHQLSGGQRQRIALARALAVEPRVLLLDEPFGALDARVRKELRRWLRRLHEEIHVTSVFVTHDQDEALEVADRIVVMRAGAIEQVGTPHEVFHNPATEFVLHFLGEVNAFHGRVHGDAVHVAGLALPLPAGDSASAGETRVFVRPHDVTIDTVRPDRPALEADVLAIRSAGAAVRVELRTAAGQALVSEISHERFGTMGLEAGSRVYVRPRHIRVFSGDPEHPVSPV
jgi:sulfate/thiosulfate transport system ATP-binding protein